VTVFKESYYCGNGRGGVKRRKKNKKGSGGAGIEGKEGWRKRR